MITSLRLAIGSLAASAVPLAYATTAGGLATWAVVALVAAWTVWAVGAGALVYVYRLHRS